MSPGQRTVRWRTSQPPTKVLANPRSVPLGVRGWVPGGPNPRRPAVSTRCAAITTPRESSRNLWLDRRALAYAHRGGAAEAPASTLYAMRGAMRAGVNALELDIRSTADGELVVFHDARVRKATGESGAVAKYPLHRLRHLDPAAHFVPRRFIVLGADPAQYSLVGRAPEDPDLRVHAAGMKAPLNHRTLVNA